MSVENRYRQYISRGGQLTYKEWKELYGERQPLSTRLWATFIVVVLLLVILLGSCAPAKYGYGNAKITLYKGKVSVQLLEKLKALPDTTIEAIIIKPIR